MSKSLSLYVVKVGGAVLEQEADRKSFLADFAAASSQKVLVHGGGRRATSVAKALDVEAPMVNGRRITNDEMLEVAMMVYGGLMNKGLVAELQSLGCNALGMTGADGNLIEAHKRPVRDGIDYGWAGDVDQVNADFLSTLLSGGITPVLAPLTHDREGQMLNTNADTIANEVAIGLSGQLKVHLIYLFEQPGVMEDLSDEKSIIRHLNPSGYQVLKSNDKIHSGMIPKLDNAFLALDRGVSSVRIGRFDRLAEIMSPTSDEYTLIQSA
ncbi:MAG: acetylglutamate kinase [Bacteroidota bacterium]